MEDEVSIIAKFHKLSSRKKIYFWSLTQKRLIFWLPWSQASEKEGEIPISNVQVLIAGTCEYVTHKINEDLKMGLSLAL